MLSLPIGIVKVMRSPSGSAVVGMPVQNAIIAPCQTVSIGEQVKGVRPSSFERSPTSSQLWMDKR